jgi:hypothetical protein
MRKPRVRHNPTPNIDRTNGFMPSLRTTYSLAQRRALWSLAESNPTIEEYHREKARILGGE